MTPKYKTLWLVLLVLAGVALLAGCNDTLRQFIVPIPKPAGNPALLGNAVVLSTNPVGGGSTMHIDVSGDSLAGVVTTGSNPVFLGKAGGNAYIINGDGTITAYSALTPLTANVHTITAAPGTTGIVAGGTSSSGNFFTTNSGTNNSSVVLGLLAVSQLVAAGSQPVAVAGNTANSKIYVVNRGDNTVTVISTTDNTVVKTIPVGAQPIWAVMSADGVDVFVVNQGAGTVSVIDTTLDIVFATITVGPSPNFAFYDPNRQRVYVSNTGNSTVSVIKADGINLGASPQVLPVLLSNVTVSGVPVSVAALNDGSKAYAALGNCPAGTNHTTLLANLALCGGTQVSVIDAIGLREVRTITVGAGAVSVDVAGDASRAYVVAAGAGTVADIRPATDTVIANIPAPLQSLSCTNPANCPATAGQTPFMVRVFP